MGAGSSNITINLNYGIAMALVNSGSPGLTQNISVVSRAIDNNGTLHYYDTDNIPIPSEDREFTLEVINNTGSITPNEGNFSDFGFNSTFTGMIMVITLSKLFLKISMLQKHLKYIN